MLNGSLGTQMSQQYYSTSIRIKQNVRTEKFNFFQRWRCTRNFSIHLVFNRTLNLISVNTSVLRKWNKQTTHFSWKYSVILQCNFNSVLASHPTLHNPRLSHFHFRSFTVFSKETTFCVFYDIPLQTLDGNFPGIESRYK